MAVPTGCVRAPTLYEDRHPAAMCALPRRGGVPSCQALRHAAVGAGARARREVFDVASATLAPPYENYARRDRVVAQRRAPVPGVHVLNDRY